MSLIHTISLHDDGRIHKTPIGNGSPRLALSTSSISPKDLDTKMEWYPNRIQDHNIKSQHKKSPNIDIDPFLAKYIKPVKFECSLNNHKLFLNSINKEAQVDQVNTYEKYLRNNNLRLSINHKELKKSEKSKDIEKIPVDIRSSVSSHGKEQRQVSSPSKSPLDSNESIVRSLPDDFMECFIDDLVNLISRMLNSLISLNDKSVPESIKNPRLSTTASSNNNLLTRYHSRVPPSISVRTYLTRLTKFNNLSPITLLTTIYYIDLLSHHYQPYFTLNSWTVHRFLLVSTMISQKLMEDFFFTNDHYAKVGGVAISELNCLEVDFLYRVEWKCIPAKQLEGGKSSIRYAKDVLDLYYSQLITLMGNNITKGDMLTYIPRSSPSNVEENDTVSMNDFDEDEDDDSISSLKLEPEKSDLVTHKSKFDEKGFSIDGSSSPHLKRKYERA